MKRGAKRPILTGREIKFSASLPQVGLAPAPTAYHNPSGPAQSQGFLCNDSLSDCVVVSMLRYKQRQDPGFVPTDDMARDIFNALGAPPDGLDPFATLTAWQAGTLPHIGKIAGWIQLDLSDATQLMQAVMLTKGFMACLTLAPDAESTFPAPWATHTLGDPGQDGHCILADGFDQAIADVPFDRITWNNYLIGGINLAFLAEFGFAGAAVIQDEQQLADLRQIGAL